MKKENSDVNGGLEEKNFLKIGIIMLMVLFIVIVVSIYY